MKAVFFHNLLVFSKENFFPFFILYTHYIHPNDAHKVHTALHPFARNDVRSSIF